MRPSDLRAARERLGLSQQQLADGLNTVLGTRYQRHHVSRWESPSNREHRRVPPAVAILVRSWLGEKFGPEQIPP